MRKNIIWIIALVFAALAAGCADSFLSEEPHGHISSEQMDKSEKSIRSLILGMYSNLPKAGTGGTSDHDDFGQKSIDITTDIMCGDMAMPNSNYGWFRDAESLDAYLSTSYRTAMVWRYYFRVIKSANDVFDVLGDDMAAPEGSGELRYYYGQAKAMRAYAYFFLANYYAGPYDENMDKKVLPIYHTQKTEATEGLSTLKDVYAFIEQDLLDAIDALKGFNRKQLSDINIDVAQGLLAYTYLAIGENGLMGDQQWLNDVCYMRFEEMYLIAAEASARNDELGKAETYLKTLLNERDPEFASTLNGKSKNELLDLIYHNWRVEMWGEGRGLMTMKRFKKGVKRGNNHYAHQGEIISYDDPRMTFEIPEVEIVNNPDIAK